MSDENRDQEAAETRIDPVPTVGSQLKAAREAKQMSVGDIAMALKLGARQVEALESGNWQSLPGQTFIRGFVRNYARLLQVDPTPLMGQLDAVLDSPQLRLTLPGQKRQVTMPQAGRPRRRDYAMVWIGAVLVAVAMGIYFLLPEDLSELQRSLDSVVAVFTRRDEPPAQAPASAESAPKASQSEPVFPPGSTPQQVMNPQATTSGEGANAAPPTAPAPASSALVPPSVQQGGQVKQPQQAEPQASQKQEVAPVPVPSLAAEKAAVLRFTFAQDSWVEVRDRQGRILFSQLNRAGSEQSVDGQGPFSLVIGNAPGVKLSLRGKSVDLASHTQGNVARLTLE